MRRIVSSVLVAAALAASGCTHITTKVPGTLDMRSDGADATPDTRPMTLGKEMSRSNFDAIMLGDGVQQSGSQVKVIDRKYWILQLVPATNESATEEIQAAMGSGALRKVKFGETQSVTDVVVGYVGAIVPIVGLVVPPRTVTLEGERVQTGVGGGAASVPTP
jgi:formylmethanofuran dehydrogenase subunit B